MNEAAEFVRNVRGYRRGWFGLVDEDNQCPLFLGIHLKHESWNGWAKPLFPVAVGIQIMEHLESKGVAKTKFVGSAFEVSWVDDGGTDIIARTGDGLFDFGSVGWTWTDCTDMALARAFAARIRDELTPEQMTLVNERNATGDGRTCATHDFLDANMVMYEAFEAIMGRKWELNSNADNRLTTEAWDMAQEADFYVRSKVPDPSKPVDPAANPDSEENEYRFDVEAIDEAITYIDGSPFKGRAAATSLIDRLRRLREVCETFQPEGE